MKHYILFLFFVSISLFTIAQKPTDYELWTGGTFQLRVNKPLSIDITEQFRFNDTISSYYKSLTELGMKYRFGKGFSVKGMYRYTLRPTRQSQHRLAADLNYKFDKKGFPLIFNYRLRFQNVMAGNSTYLRNKLGLTYKMSKVVDPFFAYEAFFRFNGKNEFRTNRYTFGLDWRLMKELHMNTYFRIEDEINVKNPERQNIIGLTLEYTLKVKKKRSAPKD